MWSSGQMVMWSSVHVVKWSSGHVVKWSSGHVVMWSNDTQIIMNRPTRFSPHVSYNVKPESTDVIFVANQEQALQYILGALRCTDISMYNRSRVHPEGALTKSKWRPPCER